MISAGVYNAQRMLTRVQIIGNFAHGRLILVGEINRHDAADRRCHLIHQAARLAEVNIFCVLPDFCNVNSGQLVLAEKAVDDDADHGLICRG